MVDQFEAGDVAGARAHRVRAAVALITAAALAGASCSPEPSSAPTPLPSTPPLNVPSQGATPSGPTQPNTDRDAAITAYRQYWNASQQAARSPEAEARRILAPVSTPGLITEQLRGIRNLQAKQREPWGRVTIHVSAVEVTGNIARLSDCQDVSQSGLADSRTHQLIPGTRGSTRPVNYSVRLQRGDDNRWRVSAVRAMEAPCKFPTGSAS